MPSDYDVNADSNASRISDEIDTLSRSHWRVPLVTRDYGDFWRHAKNIVQLFKSLKPIRKEDREELWERYSSLCDETKQTQDNEFQEKQCTSERHKRDILSEVSSAAVQDLFGFDPPDIEEMKSYSQKLKNARRMLSDYKLEMIGEHKQECFGEIQERQREHDAWWEGLRKHKSQKHEEFQARVRSNIEKNKEMLDKATAALESHRRAADNLRDKISDSHSDGWISKAEGWLSDLEDKINDIEESIIRIQNWIKEGEDKLD
jgi:uncharacterized membrane protein